MAAAGILLGLLPGVPRLPLTGALILLLFVPALVFEAAMTLELAEARAQALPIGLLASAGVLVTILLVGVPAHLLLGLSPREGLLLGALLASTDPISAVALLRRLNAPRELTALLEGECLFNDATAVAASPQDW